MENLYLKYLKQCVVVTLYGIIGAVLAVLIVGLLIAMFSFPVYGFGSLSMSLYFSIAFAVCVAPVGAILGASFKVYVYMENRQTDKNKTPSRLQKYVLFIPILIFILIPSYILLNTGRQKPITHSAYWVTFENEDCPYAEVGLFLTDFEDEWSVCSVEVLHHLETTNPDVVPVTFRVTYDFNDVRGIWLQAVDQIQVESSAVDANHPCQFIEESHPYCSLEGRAYGVDWYSSTWTE